MKGFILLYKFCSVFFFVGYRLVRVTGKFKVDYVKDYGDFLLNNCLNV